MKAIFKFSTVVLLLLLLIGLVVFVSVGYSVYSGKGATVKLVNLSGQVIVEASVSVAGQTCSVKKLGSGGEIQCHFKNLHEGSYSISATMQNGEVFLEPNLGYVTGGINFNDTITINQSGVIALVSKSST